MTDDNVRPFPVKETVPISDASDENADTLANLIGAVEQFGAGMKTVCGLLADFDKRLRALENGPTQGRPEECPCHCQCAGPAGELMAVDKYAEMRRRFADRMTAAVGNKDEVADKLDVLQDVIEALLDELATSKGNYILNSLTY